MGRGILRSAARRGTAREGRGTNEARSDVDGRGPRRPLPGARPGRRPAVRAGPAAVALLAALLGAAAPAAAQDEPDREPVPERPEAADRPAPRSTPPPGPVDASGRPVPDQGRPRDPRYIPEDRPFDPAELPGGEPAVTPVPPSFLDQIVLRPEARLRAGSGWDSNVFRSERGRTQDGFFRARGEAELLATLPTGTEIFGEVAGEGLFYFEQSRANEYFGTTFVEVFQPLTRWLDAGIQNAFEASRTNLLDDNGDLFPRGRFGSLDEEVRVYGIVRPHADWAVEAGASLRWKDYEENRFVESLDYDEVRGDAAVSWRVARQPRTRFKLKYRFRRRDYHELSARERDGTLAPDAAELDVQRHQVNLTLFQDLRPAAMELRLILGGAWTYNRDLHENDRSYRELSGSGRVEWWLLPKKTRLDLTARGVVRDFLVRKSAGKGGNLHHRLADVTVGVWQQLVDTGRGVVAVWGDATMALWKSGDPLEGYERFILQAGLELSW